MGCRCCSKSYRNCDHSWSCAMEIGLDFTISLVVNRWTYFVMCVLHKRSLSSSLCVCLENCWVTINSSFANFLFGHWLEFERCEKMSNGLFRRAKFRRFIFQGLFFALSSWYRWTHDELLLQFKVKQEISWSIDNQSFFNIAIGRISDNIASTRFCISKTTSS